MDDTVQQLYNVHYGCNGSPVMHPFLLDTTSLSEKKHSNLHYLQEGNFANNSSVRFKMNVFISECLHGRLLYEVPTV